MKINAKGLRKLAHNFFYKDVAKVERAQLTTIGRTDDYTTEYITVYENMPCHLAQYGKELAAHRDDTSQKITWNLRLDFDPKYKIEADDLIKVKHQGQTFTLFAGTQINYISHAELDVRRRKEAEQD